MRNKTLPLTMLAGAMMLGVSASTASAGALPVATIGKLSGDVVQVWHTGRPHRVYRYPRQRIVVHPHGYAQSGYYPDYNATYRGFEDPGFAIRGNMPGCAVDLGYGRWESCDK